MQSKNSSKSSVQSNNVLVKAHGGELKVESNEREGAEFIIQLPVF
ncbi:MAG: HAMP domain-containing histidine kinase [Saprospiraceae bacterium]|nr:HAMP domain-containing histidine kinase [Saprospiraceae bacterium]